MFNESGLFDTKVFYLRYKKYQKKKKIAGKKENLLRNIKKGTSTHRWPISSNPTLILRRIIAVFVEYSPAWKWRQFCVGRPLAYRRRQRPADSDARSD